MTCNTSIIDYRYPDPDARLRQMHSLQTTESFVILAENNYMYDPCERIFYDDSLPHYPQTHSFESDISGRIIIMDKNGTTVGVITDIPAMFVTHVLGSYEAELQLRFLEDFWGGLLGTGSIII